MKCEACPAPSGLRCHGERVPRLCELGATGPEYRDYLAKGCEEQPRITEEQRAAVVKSQRLLSMMKDCPNWKKRTDCGCGVNECGFAWRRRTVSHQDCFGCLEGQPIISLR